MVDKICIRCEKKKKHYAKGLCKCCYNRTKYSNKCNEYYRHWKEKNPNYFKEYYQRKKMEKLNE